MGFDRIKREDCSKVFSLLHKNSLVLKQTADSAFQAGNYGVARSLVILSSEEYIKGAILFLNGIGIDLLRIKEIKKALGNHKQRHEVAMLFRMLQLWETLKEIEEYKPKNLFKKKWLNNAHSFLEKAEILLKPFEPLAISLSWWNNANSFKNAGLYVDYFNEPVLPQDITELDYKVALGNVDELISKFESFRSFISQEDEEVIKVLVASLNKGLEEFEKNSKK